MNTAAWDKTVANLSGKVGQTFRSGAYRLLSIDDNGLNVEWIATGKVARVWRSLIEKTAERQTRGETIRERTISYTVIIEFFVREALCDTVVVISCAKSKAPVAKAAAKDLYKSTAFTLARKFAEKTAKTWAILSAKHGLLNPETEVETYDMSLPTAPKSYRAAWAAAVAEQIEAAANSIRTRFVVIAGSVYRAAFESVQVFGSSAVQWDCPVAGFEIGEICGFLSTALKGV